MPIVPIPASEYFLTGNAHGRLEEWLEAAQSYQNAIAADPHFADAYNNLGIALLELERNPEAIAAFARAIEINPDHANAYFNLGKVLARRNEFAIAFELFEKTLSIQPLHAYALHELGTLQEKTGLLERAASSYRRSMELDPTRTVRENLAAVLTLIGDADGIARLEELVREQPLAAESHWNLGMGLLLHARYEQGWSEYEWRTEIPRFHKYHHRFAQPRWNGGALEGQTILLYGEQGHGDTLQFMRYIPLVAERGGRVILEVHPALHRLLQGVPGVAECIANGDVRPDFATHAALMSLPHLLRAYAIPAPVAPAVQAWRNPHCSPAVSLQLADLKVGIAWAGNPGHKRDRLRSIPLQQWKPLAQIEGVAWTSLQVVPTGSEFENGERNFNFVEDSAGLPDFAELAAIVSTLDLIITVDTAVAHLAGSMGKPVWILLSNAVDWRWGLHGTSTQWYPCARLFRQTTPADWTTVMAAVSQELERLTASRAPNHSSTKSQLLQGHTGT